MKRLHLSILAVSFTLAAQSQYFTGLNGSAYGGITTVNFNPAIANSPFIADINLFGIGASVNNNYIGISRQAIFNTSLLNNPNFQSQDIYEKLNGRDKSVFAGVQIEGPLSFMFSFGPKKHPNKNALAFSYHTNFIVNADNINQTLARTMFYGMGSKAEGVTNFVGQNLSDANLNLKTLAWNDYGVTYSRIVYENGDNLIKAGGTLKLLEPLAGAYFYSKDLDYKWPELGLLSVFKSNVNYAYSQGIITSAQYSPQQITQSLPGYLNNVLSYKYATPTVAADLGAVYEWRPTRDDNSEKMDCGTLTGYEPKPYKLAAGASIIDFGAVRFKQGPNSGNFNVNIQDWDVANAKFPKGIQSFSDTLNSRFQSAQGNKNYFTMWLPTRFNLYIDYNIQKGFGLIASSTISPNMSPNGNMVHQVTVFTGTVKYENKWFGLYVPVSYDVLGNLNLGVTLRAGPLIVGSQDILGLLMRKYACNEEIHAALKIFIPYHKIHRKYDVRFNKEG